MPSGPHYTGLDGRIEDASTMLYQAYSWYDYQIAFEQRRTECIHEERPTIQHTVGGSIILSKSSLRRIYPETSQDRSKAPFRSGLS